MKNLTFVFILIIYCSFLYSQTTIPGGNVSGTWLQTGSPYLIEGEITITDGHTLNIEPGCLVEFQGHYKFNVQGRLLAEGTEQDSIKFTVADTTGYYNNTHIGWHGLRFDNTPSTNDSSKFVYCHLEFGKAIGADWSERRGGSVFIDNFSKVRISHCNLINNYANSSGGAVYDSSSIRIDSSTVSNNQSGNEGGGISINGYPANKLTNLTINYNSALTGGGLYLESNSEIINCKIANNHSQGIYIRNISPKIINSLICNNGGTGIYAVSDEWDRMNPKINNCTIANNGGHGMGYYYSDPWPINNTKSENKQNGITVKPSVLRSITGMSNIFSENLMGSVYSNSSPNLTYCAFSDDLPSFAGIGCISTEPHFIDPTAGVGIDYNALEADWSLQSNSTCINHGIPDTTGLDLPEIDLTGNPRVFQGNVPRIDIGAYEFQGEPDQIPDIYVYPNNFDFYLCTIDSFSVEKSFMISNIGFDDLEVASINGPEGFLVKREDDLEFGSTINQFAVEVDSTETINVIFNPNAAIIYSGNITIISNDPDENISTVGVTGIGDIYPVVYSNISEDTIWDSEIIKVTGNITVSNGKTLTITPGTNVKFMNRYTIDVQGRIIAEGTEQDSISFISKDSDSWWDGIEFVNTPVLNDSSKFAYCKFSRSFHTPGGAFQIWNFNKIKFDYCVFINNKAVNYGGAIYANYSNISISNSQFIANEALADWDYMWSCPGFGAGLYIVNSNIELTNCIIKNNYAHCADDTPYGGGIYSSFSDLKLINCQFYENNADYVVGKALYLRRSNLDLYNSIISKHDSYSGNVIYATDSTNVFLINTIIYNNSGDYIVFSPWGVSNTFSSDYSCIEGGESSIITNANATINWYENNIEEDPLFVDYENGDFHLQSGSPCINAGTPSGWIVPFSNLSINEILDYDCIDDNYDIGYFEYQDFMIDQNEIYFGEIPFSLITEGVQVIVSNLSEEDILISSIEASEHFLIKQNIEDEYVYQIGTIELIADSEVSFWVACRPMSDGLIAGEVLIISNAIPSRAIITVSANVNRLDIPKLYNNFPNPFNPETIIRFSIPQESRVELIAYNIKGQEVKILVDHTCEIGINTVIWDGTNDSGKQVSTGVYFYKLNVEGKTIKTKKMLLLK